MPRARESLEDLKAAHAALKGLGLPHALIGGWAVIAWGVVRATRDLDLLAVVLLEDHAKLARRFEKLGYSVDRRRGGVDDPIPDMVRLELKGQPERPEVDILVATKGFDQDVLRRAVELDLGGWTIPVACPEDLIAMKLSAGGAVDIADAKSLLEVQKARLDEPLLLQACKRLRVDKKLKHIREFGF